MIEDIYKKFLECDGIVSTDTRNILPNSLFFALKGANFNGNLFAIEALKKDAKYCIIDENIEENEALILVDDVLLTLQKLANYHRNKLGVNIIGIGGSNGKTTTKELLYSVFSTQFNCFCTQGNFNNHIGVPLTLLQLKPDHQVAIVELGANKIGDIKELCEIAEPNSGIITNIGKEHLEGFGNIEGVAQAESELFDFLIKTRGFCFVNIDDFWLNNMSKRIGEKREYSIHDNNLILKKQVPAIVFDWNETIVNSHLPGIHNFQNIVAVIAIASHYGVSESNIKKGIEAYQPQNNRSQFIKTEKNFIYLDAYNANPSSVMAALITFKELNNQTQLAIIGDMFELGKFEDEEHQAIASFCESDCNFEVILVGNAFAKTRIINSNIKIFAKKEDAIQYCISSKFENYNVLLKGSRGMKIEDFKTVF